MTKKNIKIAKSLSITETAAIKSSIIDLYFDEDVLTGKITYTNSWREMNELLSFIDYYVSGITFSEEDKGHEYDLIIADKKLMKQYRKFRRFNKSFKLILTDVKEMVEHRKMLLANESPLNILVDEITKLVKDMSGNINMKDISALLPELAKLGKGLNQEDLVAQVLKNMPQDHKKAKKPVATATKEKVEDFPKDSDIYKEV